MRKRTDPPPPQLPGVLQLSAEPLKTWVGDGRGGRFRPLMCVVVDADTSMCLAMDMAEEGEAPHEVAHRTLGKVAGVAAAAGRPLRVQVRDPELATVLRRRIELGDVHFEIVERLDAVNALMSALERDVFPRRPDSPLGRTGLSPERLAAFAEGCAAYHAARPWRLLHDDDLVEVRSPVPPKGMRCASVLGAGGQVVGIGFFNDRRAYDRMVAGAAHAGTSKAARWALMFYAPDELPPDDADLWDEHGLRVAADESVPVLLRYLGSTKVERPDGPTLTFVEGLCRAIAATSEAEFDSGRWDKSVTTFDGPVTYELAIPHLLDPSPEPGAQPVWAVAQRSMQQIVRAIEQSGARTAEEANALLAAGAAFGAPDAGPPASDAERATDLCYEARGQRSRRALHLIREALRLDPDCAEAYVLLAERESDPAAAEPIYRSGVEAGRRALGEEAFSVPGYPFWLALESRPFMRAMSGLAESLEMQGKLEEAADFLREMLRLNPGDNQGVRYRCVPLLLALGRLDEVQALLRSEMYRDDASALWDYAGALLAFKQGRRDEADRMLGRATERNPTAIAFILNPDLMPPAGPPTWSPGDAGEAVMVGDLLGPVWHEDRAAVRWLRERKAARAASARPAKSKPKSAAKPGAKSRPTPKAKPQAQPKPKKPD